MTSEPPPGHPPRAEGSGAAFDVGEHLAEDGGSAGPGGSREPAGAEQRGGAAYGPMVEELRAMLDAMAAAALDEARGEELRARFAAVTSELEGLRVPARDRAFGHRLDLPGRGQTLSPAFVVEAATADRVRGTVTFGPYFHGGAGAVHGGAIPLVLDEVLGRLANSGGRTPCRTAYLHVDYRSVTPLERPLGLTAWVERIEGRKRLLRATLADGEHVCAEAEGLFLELLPGQP